MPAGIGISVRSSLDRYYLYCSIVGAHIEDLTVNEDIRAACRRRQLAV